MLKMAAVLTTFTAVSATSAHAEDTRAIGTPNGGHEILHMEMGCSDAASVGYPVPDMPGRVVQYIAPNGQVTAMGCWKRSADGKLSITWAGADPTGAPAPQPFQGNKAAVCDNLAKLAALFVKARDEGTPESHELELIARSNATPAMRKADIALVNAVYTSPGWRNVDESHAYSVTHKTCMQGGLLAGQQ
ncbi:hypothetical protein PTE30175_03655 [Pandoraea terrae]|uniref:Uncharacterized protein n=2 Tax=Pandoraea terrae TaxID=1537710 RepID=A0A5E4X9K8_9BURK|nr:hypothetical protein PTE30175_03655 [Pandoraea terrae]